MAIINSLPVSNPTRSSKILGTTGTERSTSNFTVAGLEDLILGAKGDRKIPVQSQLNFTTSEPSSLTEGDRYINTTTGVSSITGINVIANYIYEVRNLAWTEIVPAAGFTVWDIATSKNFTYSGSAWIGDFVTEAQLAATNANVTTNTSNIATNTTGLATNTSAIAGLQAGQTGGLKAFRTLAALQAYGSPTTQDSFKVTDDSTSSNNGYYHWISGTNYVKDDFQPITSDEVSSTVTTSASTVPSNNAVFSELKFKAKLVNKSYDPRGTAKVGDSTPTATLNHVYFPSTNGTIFGTTVTSFSNSLLVGNGSSFDVVQFDSLYREFEYVVAATDTPASLKPYAINTIGLAGIRAAISEMFTRGYGGSILCLPGTFDGSLGVDLRLDDIYIKGVGNQTKFRRTGSTSDIFDNTGVTGIRIENIDCRVIVEHADSGIELINVVTDKSKSRLNNIIKVGTGLDFETVRAAYASVEADAIANGNKYLIEVYNDTVETSPVYIDAPGISIKGFNRPTIKHTSNSSLSFFNILKLSSGSHGLFEGFDIVRDGEVDGWNFAAFYVKSDTGIFKDINVYNNTTVPSSYLPLAADDYPVNTHGDRRHGTVIETSDVSKVYFENVNSYGSPFGFHNTRGYYLHNGSGTLVNCTGVGGGIGIWGHGIICHRGSNYVLRDCTGIGSPYNTTRQESSGIKFQQQSASKLYNCTGYGGANCEGGHGIWAGFYSLPQLYNCNGYTGRGANSSSLKIDQQSKPFVKGGYYGLDKVNYTYNFVKNGGSQSMLFLPYANFAYQLNALAITVKSSSGLPSTTGYKYKVYTDEGTPRLVFELTYNGSDMSLNPYTLYNIQVPSNVSLKMSVFDHLGNPFSPSDSSFEFHANIISAEANCDSFLLDTDESAVIEDCYFEANRVSNGLKINNNALQALNFYINKCTIDVLSNKVGINCESATANLPISHTKVNGTLSNVSSFVTEASLLNSSNYS